LAAGDKRRRPSDEQLLGRSADLSRRFLGGLAKPVSIAWATNQNSRWGSCTPADGTIRISARVKGMPSWVLDYVILHELTHLLQPGHGGEFWSLLESYPRTERARGYLEGVAAAAGLLWPDDVTDDLAETRLQIPVFSDVNGANPRVCLSCCRRLSHLRCPSRLPRAAHPVPRPSRPWCPGT